MLHWLPAPLLGVICALTLLINTVFWCVPVYCLILIKLITPRGRMRSTISRGIAWNAQLWAMVNICLTNVLIRIKWDVRMNAEIDHGNQYLVCANHQSRHDILMLMVAFGRTASSIQFFRSEEHTSELQYLMI